jgi:hypothetical protein
VGIESFLQILEAIWFQGLRTFVGKVYENGAQKDGLEGGLFGNKKKYMTEIDNNIGQIYGDPIRDDFSYKCHGTHTALILIRIQ